MLARVTAVCVCCLAGASVVDAQIQGVNDRTVRPEQDAAMVRGCMIAKPGEYAVQVGDIIELDYTFPVIPEAIPKKVNHKQTLTGAVRKSPLGFREIVIPLFAGTQTIAFYFDAKNKGEETVTLIIDGTEYKYSFKVEEE